MPSRERVVDRATQRAHRTIRDLGTELLEARQAAGVTQRDVGAAAHVSASTVSRVERGLVPDVSVLLVARLFGVVGLDLGARAYPAGPPLRDAAHLALLARLRAILHPGLRWQTEVPVTGRDLRTWDATLSTGVRTAGVEAETRVRDMQALDRRVQLKRQDAEIDVVILVLSDTHWNRRVVREHAPALGNYPLRTRDVVAALRHGLVPEASGIAVL
jgi:transcriptional regulator with XRE-family HTH domain